MQRIWCVVVFAAALGAGWWLGRLPLSVIGAYGVMSIVCFVVYALDKSAARRQRRRTPERVLLGLGLAGGWPGALLAQQLLRHKTVKLAFLRIFWLTVVLNVAGLAWYVTRVAG